MNEPPSSWLDDDDDPARSIRAERAADLDRLQRTMLATGNPLYAWEAIKSCHHPNYPMPYPEWVRDYLRDTAIELHVLARLLDPNTFPEQGEAETDADHMTRFEAWQRTARVSPKKAAELTVRALGLVRRGWNAYRQFFADSEASMAALEYEFPMGKTRREVLEGMLNAEGQTDERVVHRKLTRGRTLLERVPPGRSRTKPTP